MSNVIAVSGPIRKKYLNKEISNFINNMIMGRKTNIGATNDGVEIIKGEKIKRNFIISPVIVSGDAVGAVIILSDSGINEVMEKTANFISRFLSKHLE